MNIEEAKQDYLNNAATEKRISGQKILTRDDASFEFMMNALRLNQGFETALFQQHVGLPISSVEKSLKQAEEKGWINWDINRIQPTATGLQYLNTLLELFISD